MQNLIRQHVTPAVRLIVAGLLASIAGFSDSAAAADQTFGVLLKNIKNPFWSATDEGAKDAGKEIGVDVYVLASESDADVAPQLDICNTMLQRKTDALIVAAVNPTGLLPCLAQATKKGIPVLDIDANLIQDVAEKAGVNVTNSIGSDNRHAGALGADYIAKRLAKGKVLLLEGAPGALTATDRRDGFKEELAKVAPDLQIVASLTANWDRGKAADVTNDLLTRYPDLAVIFASNDQMALGAAEAARAAGKKDLMIVGVDGNPDAIQAIKEGRLTASVAQLPYLFGYNGVKMAKDILAGKKLEPWKQAVPVLVLDKAVLDAKTEPLLKYVR
jgi:ABC-type sugar transport system substrate-binding protein